MHSPIRFDVLPVVLLICSVFGSPTPNSNIETQYFNISGLASSSPGGLTSNTSLGVYPPGGPPEFTCQALSRSSAPLLPMDIYNTTIQMLEKITQADFASRMDRDSMAFVSSNNLAITARSNRPGQDPPIFRRYVMWAMIRILVGMQTVPEFGYHPVVFEPRWRGVSVGRIQIFYVPASSPPASISDDTTISANQTTNNEVNVTTTPTLLNEDQISWIFEPELAEAELTAWDIAIETMSALISAAQHSTHNFDEFFPGSIPESAAIIAYKSDITPSRLSKIILIRTLAAAALWALNDGDFHALKVTIFLYEDGIVEPIAYGGYDSLFLSTSNSTAAVNTS